MRSDNSKKTIIVLVAAAGIGLWFFSFLSEPAPASMKELRSLIDSYEPSSASDLEHCARALGTDALPLVAACLDAQTNRHQVVAGALRVCSVMGSEVRPMLPALKQLLYDQYLGRLAVPVLRQSGDEGLAVIISEFGAVTNVPVRAAIMIELGIAGGAASNAVPALLDLLSRQSGGGLKRHSVETLGRIQASPELVVPVLRKELSDPEVQFEVVRALGNFGSNAVAAVPDLERLLADERMDDESRRNVAGSLFVIRNDDGSDLDLGDFDAKGRPVGGASATTQRSRKK